MSSVAIKAKVNGEKLAIDRSRLPSFLPYSLRPTKVITVDASEVKIIYP